MSVIWPWVSFVFWFSIALSFIDFLAFTASIVYLLFFRKQKNYKIVAVQAFGYGYLVFGAWAVWNKHFSANKNNNLVISTITQSVSYSFDNLFHWVSAFVYLKAALVLPYLLDKHFYTENEAILVNYNSTQRYLKWLDWGNNSVIAVGFLSVLPMIWTKDLDAQFYTWTSVLLQLQLFFSCGAMIYAIYILNNEIKAIKNILPRTGLMVTHSILLTLIVSTALGFYVTQYF